MNQHVSVNRAPSDTRQASKSTSQRSHIGMAGLALLIGAAGIVLAATVAESSMTAEQHIMLFEQSSLAP
jgi:Tfp pilus assembly protein PilN